MRRIFSQSTEAADFLLLLFFGQQRKEGVFFPDYINGNLQFYHPAAILRNMGMYDLLKGDMEEIVNKYGN